MVGKHSTGKYIFMKNEAAINDISQRIEVLRETIQRLEKTDRRAAERLKKALQRELGAEHQPRKTNGRSNPDSAAMGTPIVRLHSKDLFSTAGTIVKQAVSHPTAGFKQLFEFGKDMSQVILGTSEFLPKRNDRRFSDPTWFENPIYRRYMQAYFAWHKHLNDWVDDAEFDNDDSRRAKFIISLFAEAVAPSNTLVNPAVIKRFFETGGMSLEKGLLHLLDDIRHNGGMPAQVDKSAFSVGKNIATSEGNVVFRCDILELIQYKPTTEKVFKIPLFIIPPQINKFYAFDLSPEKSFIRFCTSIGLQVFIVSWRNPTPEHRNWGLDQYILGLSEAVHVIHDIAEVDNINILGACSGGLTSVLLSSYLQSLDKPIINSITQLVSIIDTQVNSDIALFVTEKTLETAKQTSAAKGVLEGRDMARAFAWMRPTDLIWNYWVNNYLLGKEPPAFDILYWNNDTTRLPAKLHAEFIDIYKENSLMHPNTLKIAGQPVDAKALKQDVFAVAGLTDHITLWDACYRSTLLLGGQCEFILSNSGHIQSILNPPGNPKAHFFTNKAHVEDPSEWYQGATRNNGSWWEHWQKWIIAHSGEEKEAPVSLGNEQHPPLEPAPGLYVHD